MPDRVKPGQSPSEAAPFFVSSTKLTPRQKEVLSLAAQGLSEEEIALRLVLSVWTVRSYTRTAREALGARNMTQAVARALAGQLISMSC